jgi:hypothetical protein
MDKPLSGSEYSCKYCKKGFKKAVVRDKHEYEQVCVANGHKTYCKVCTWTAENILAYNEHLISREHLDKVGRINVTGLDMIIVNPVQDKSYPQLFDLSFGE